MTKPRSIIVSQEIKIAVNRTLKQAFVELRFKINITTFIALRKNKTTLQNLTLSWNFFFWFSKINTTFNRFPTKSVTSHLWASNSISLK